MTGTLGLTTNLVDLRIDIGQQGTGPWTTTDPTQFGHLWAAAMGASTQGLTPTKVPLRLPAYSAFPPLPGGGMMMCSLTSQKVPSVRA
jgi:hypothetical protein